MSGTNTIKGMVFILMAVLLLSVSVNAHAGKVFIGTPVQKDSPVAASLAGMPPIVGPKKLIAVGSFENKTNFSGQWNLGDGMAEMLTTSLMQSARFIVLERPEVERILREQNFAASGRTTGEGGAKIGKVLRAQILVIGAITEFSSRTEDSSLGVSTKKIGLGLNVAKAHIAINLRMIDTTTGQVLYSERIAEKAQRTNVAADYTSSDFAIGGSHFKKTPLGEVTQKAIDRAVIFIARKMQNLPWKGRVVMVKEDKIFINAGSQSAIKPGMAFTVYNPGEALIDPETGMDLGSDETLIGKIQVAEVKDKFSIAIATEGEEFDRNDIVKYEVSRRTYSAPPAGGPPPPPPAPASQPRVIQGVPVQ